MSVEIGLDTFRVQVHSNLVSSLSSRSKKPCGFHNPMYIPLNKNFWFSQSSRFAKLLFQITSPEYYKRWEPIRIKRSACRLCLHTQRSATRSKFDQSWSNCALCQILRQFDICMQNATLTQLCTPQTSPLTPRQAPRDELKTKGCKDRLQPKDEDACLPIITVILNV